MLFVFREDWYDSWNFARCRHGRVLTTGGATGGRASGIPFAIVSAHSSSPPSAQAYFGYRFGISSSGAWFWAPCPRDQTFVHNGILGEFEDHFAEMANWFSAAILPTDPRSPWQNGRTELAGEEWKLQGKFAWRK